MTSSPPEPFGATAAAAPPAAPALRRGLRPVALFATAFVLLCGGPYGLEEVVPRAGPGLSVAVLLLMALFWAAPYALLVSELASALPAEGGIYQWFRAGVGPFWSFQISYMEWTTWVLDAALYPPLVAAFIGTLLVREPSHGLRWALCLGIIWGCTWLNIRGVRLVGRFSVLMTALMMAPLVILIVLGWRHASLAHLAPFVPPDVSPYGALNYALLWALWSYSGYGTMANASEEIVEPERTYPKVLAVILPVSALSYVLPLVVSLGVTPDWKAWDTAQFNQVALSLGGPLLMLSMTLAAHISSVGIFNGELLVISRLPYAMSRDGVLPAGLSRLHPVFATPARILILQAVVYSVLTYFLGFVELLIVSTWLALPSYLLQFASPVVLRLKRPDLRGPFRIPGRLPVLVLVAAIPSLIALYALFTITLRHLLIGLGFVALGPILFLGLRHLGSGSPPAVAGEGAQRD